ncbi:hypothetical protein HK101_003143 [Irineochytrium annulatum]|nr:hypothetical protein HK101_003143 [Irineochytrium annulatum]
MGLWWNLFVGVLTLLVVGVLVLYGLAQHQLSQKARRAARRKKRRSQADASATAGVQAEAEAEGATAEDGGERPRQEMLDLTTERRRIAAVPATEREPLPLFDEAPRGARQRSRFDSEERGADSLGGDYGRERVYGRQERRGRDSYGTEDRLGRDVRQYDHTDGPDRGYDRAGGQDRVSGYDRAGGQDRVSGYDRVSRSYGRVGGSSGSNAFRYEEPMLPIKSPFGESTASDLRRVEQQDRTSPYHQPPPQEHREEYHQQPLAHQPLQVPQQPRVARLMLEDGQKLRKRGAVERERDEREEEGLMDVVGEEIGGSAGKRRRQVVESASNSAMGTPTPNEARNRSTSRSRAFPEERIRAIEQQRRRNTPARQRADAPPPGSMGPPPPRAPLTGSKRKSTDAGGAEDGYALNYSLTDDNGWITPDSYRRKRTRIGVSHMSPAKPASRMQEVVVEEEEDVVLTEVTNDIVTEAPGSGTKYNPVAQVAPVSNARNRVKLSSTPVKAQKERANMIRRAPVSIVRKKLTEEEIKRKLEERLRGSTQDNVSTSIAAPPTTTKKSVSFKFPDEQRSPPPERSPSPARGAAAAPAVAFSVTPATPPLVEAVKPAETPLLPTMSAAATPALGFKPPVAAPGTPGWGISLTGQATSTPASSFAQKAEVASENKATTEPGKAPLPVFTVPSVAETSSSPAAPAGGEIKPFGSFGSLEALGKKDASPGTVATAPLTVNAASSLAPAGGFQIGVTNTTLKTSPTDGAIANKDTADAAKTGAPTAASSGFGGFGVLSFGAGGAADAKTTSPPKTGLFNLPAATTATSAPATASAAPAFGFGQLGTPATSTTAAPSVPLFGQAVATSTPAATEKPAAAPAFSFPSFGQTPAASVTPATPAAEAPKTSLNFGTPATPAFGTPLASTPAQATAAAPTFGFGTPASTSTPAAAEQKPVFAFGQQLPAQQQQPAATGGIGIFGAANQQTQSQQPALFGQPAQQQPTQPTIGFGQNAAATSTPATAPTPFGQAPAGAGQQAPAAPTTGGFGGFGFGNTGNTGNGSTTSFGFGQQPQQAEQGNVMNTGTPTFGFGAQPSAAAPTTTPSFGFGASAAAAPTATSFGAPAPSFGASSSTGSFSFGGTGGFGQQPQGQQPAQQQGGFGFGAMTASTPIFGGTSSTGTGGFGAATGGAPGASAPTGFGFGATAGATPAAAPSFGFGFGQQQQAGAANAPAGASGGFAFGQQQAPSTGFSFGAGGGASSAGGSGSGTFQFGATPAAGTGGGLFNPGASSTTMDRKLAQPKSRLSRRRTAM